LLTRPEIKNLRFFPESQTEPDDDTHFDFELVNNSDYSVVIGPIRFVLAPLSSNLSQFPGRVTSLEMRDPSKMVLFICDKVETKGLRVALPSKASAKLYGILTTKSGTTPNSAYPLKYDMRVTFDWEFSQVITTGDSMGTTNTIVDD